MRPVAEIASKVGIDQLGFSPAATTAFFVWMNLSSGTINNLGADLSTKLAPTVQASWMMWVPAMTVNMSLIPAHMRILFINATAIVWTLILSNMAAGSSAATEPVRIEDPEVYSAAEEDPVPLAAALAGLTGHSRTESNVVRDVWQFMRGSDQPRRSSKEQEPPTKRFLHTLQMVRDIPAICKLSVHASSMLTLPKAAHAPWCVPSIPLLACLGASVVHPLLIMARHVRIHESCRQRGR